MTVREIDRESLLVHVDAHARFEDVERALEREGLTLDAPIVESTIGAWLEAGAPGARSAWLDPADHLVAGFSARIPASGETFSIRPAPRRAVGPDLAALVLGLRGRTLALDAVWLRVHRVGTKRPDEAFRDDEEPLSRDEHVLFDAIDEALR